MHHLCCADCNCFKIENPEPVLITKDNIKVFNGRCYCHGYFLRSNEEICVDFER